MLFQYIYALFSLADTHHILKRAAPMLLHVLAHLRQLTYASHHSQLF